MEQPGTRHHALATILAIETSCDETAAAVLDGDRVFSNIVWSQLKLHAHWGGVVPLIARRAHEERLPAVVAAALRRANLSNSSNLSDSMNSVTAIAVTIGPGLAPALEVGIAYAKKLALELGKPLIPVSHLEGHIASAFLQRRSGVPYLSHLTNWTNLANSTNWLSLIVSGGHTELVETRRKKAKGKRQKEEMDSFILHPSSFILESRLLGATLDDAAGECLDKVGRALGLGYPAGPVVEKLALKGLALPAARPGPLKFPVPMERSRRDNLNFSFSGLKTAAVRQVDQVGGMSSSGIVDFCVSFQRAVIDAILLKVRRAVALTGIKTLLLSGGVAANNELRRRLRQTMRKLGGQAFCAPKRFTGDNAAMIGLAAQWAWARGEMCRTKTEIDQIDRQPNLNFPIAD